MTFPISLGPRLAAIYHQLLPQKPVWDLCCDHGYLGIHAYRSGLFQQVHFVDQVDEIINSLKEKFLRDQSQPLIEPTPLFWTIDAKDLPSHVEGNLVIAGVGTSTIVAILDSLNSRSLLRAERIILCPQKNPLNCIDQIQCLLGANYQLSHQSLVFEKHRHRHIFVVDRHPVDP